MQTLKDLWIIAKKDLLEFIRDRLRLVTFFIMPMFMMIMVGYIFPSQNSLKNIPIGIANQDNGTYSKQLTEAIQNLKVSDGGNNVFNIKSYSNGDEIIAAIKGQEISGGLVIPPDLSQKIDHSEQAQVTIIEDQANPQVSQMVNQVLSQFVSGFSGQISAQKLGQLMTTKTSIAPPAPSELSIQAILTPIKSAIQEIIPGNPNYFEFVAPGIVAMIVMTAVLTGLAASIAREKEQGTLDGILISPINRLAIILGKALSQAIRGLIQGVIVLLLAFILFGVTVHGNYLLIALILFMGVFSFVGLGILVSSIAAEQETATQLLFMFQFPMLFLSGVFFPVQLMPDAMQAIARFIPLTYAIRSLRQVMVLGAGFGAVRSDLLILALFGVVTLAISVPIFKRVITK